MNKDTLLVIIRAVLVAIGTVFVTKGTIDNGLLEQIVGGILAVVGGIWQALAHTKALNTPVPEAKAPDAK